MSCLQQGRPGAQERTTKFGLISTEAAVQFNSGAEVRDSDDLLIHHTGNWHIDVEKHITIQQISLLGEQSVMCFQ